MATNDDLEDFFKKKDRKGKQKKQAALLTNNEELLKQLEMVTTVTTMFKENMDFDDEEGENNDGYVPTNTIIDDVPSTKSSKPKPVDQVKPNKHLNEQQMNITESGQQDEWEEFEGFNSKYDQIRLKFLGTTAANDRDEDYDDDENNPNNNNNDDQNETSGDHERNKEKPAWNTTQVKQQSVPPETTVSEQPPAPAPAPVKPPSTGAYRPPQMRGGTSVTVVGGGNPKVTKKKEVNLASTDEFPTLGSAVNKK